MNDRVGFIAAELSGAALVATGCFLVARTYAAAGPAPGRALLDRYSAYLDQAARLCFVSAVGPDILRAQAVAVVLGLGVSAALGTPALLVAPALAAVAPAAYFVRKRRQRSRDFSAQTDAFVLGLANSLKAVPNIGAALEGLLPVLHSPIKEEIALALGEMRVGSPVDQALLDVSARAQSSAFDGAVSALLIGRQVGGDLPKILETTAATIREMNRLAGVVTSKTSEARAQLGVLAFFPLGIVVLFSAVSPNFFEPLEHTVVGNIVCAVAGTLWVSAILIARQFAKVDL